MKQVETQIKHQVDTFKVVTKTVPIFEETIHPTVNFEIDGNANLTDMVAAFESFLKAVGYSIPNNRRLSFVEEF